MPPRYAPKKKRIPKGLRSKKKMLRAAITLFMENGYDSTSTADIANAAGLAQSSFFRAFANKEDLLLNLVRTMFGGQFMQTELVVGKEDPILSYATETALQLNIAELSETVRGVYVAAYSLPRVSECIRQRTVEYLEGTFKEYLTEEDAAKFLELEVASGGLMRAFMAVPCTENFTMNAKITRFLKCALNVYNVPEEKCREVTEKVLQMRLRPMAQDLLAKIMKDLDNDLSVEEIEIEAAEKARDEARAKAKAEAEAKAKAAAQAKAVAEAAAEAAAKALAEAEAAAAAVAAVEEE